jgi:hypothetical protein
MGSLRDLPGSFENRFDEAKLTHSYTVLPSLVLFSFREGYHLKKYRKVIAEKRGEIR